MLVIFWSVILFSILSYAQLSTNSYYSKLKFYRGLDGISWLKDEYPNEYEIISWLRKNAPQKSVILEAPGDSYTDYNVISSYTGIPSVLGWYVHEWLWRGSSTFPQKRLEDVTAIYNTANSDFALEKLKAYKVSYVIVGTFERLKFPLLNEEKFEKIGSLVFQAGQSKIYKID